LNCFYSKKFWNIKIEAIEPFFLNSKKINYLDTICQLLVAGTVSLNWYLLFAVGSWRSGELVKLYEEEECF